MVIMMKKNKIVSGIMAMVCLPVAFLHGQTSKEKETFSWSNLPGVEQPVFNTDTFNIVQFGSVADGLTLNTNSINKAISTCSEKVVA
ncbi:hypothetical protein A4D02_24155 [Niastella koreensis]|uniref:Glycoside hydrolase family 28 n=3 Tax=Niastella koreensis TaxID=354356 RepID=G8TDH4_NIAKG|nr:glycoside hydrolase [Niastella koreensis]AEW00424.1 glycoside hydrolase family 28 [Niastella koreensis GR20-10]OQP52289.1 hypothetical protein A4D02_24155 [Niastella koreensis]